MDEENNTNGTSAPTPNAEETETVDPADWSADETQSQMLEKVNGLLGNLPVETPAPEIAPDPTPPETPETAEVVEEETPAAEAVETPEPEADDHALAPEVQEIVNKRIGKEVGKRKALEEQAQALEEKVTTLTSQLEQASQAPAPTSGRVSPALLARDENELNQHAQSQAQLKKWCLENWDGFDSEDETQQQSLSSDQVRRLYAQVEQDIAVDLPQARQRLAARQQLEPIVQNAYPEMKNTSSQLNQVYHNLLRAVPEVQTLPSLKLVVGDSLVGAQLRAAVQDQPVGPLVEQFVAWMQSKDQSTPPAPARKKAPTLPTRSQRGGKSPLTPAPAPKKMAPGNPDFSGVDMNDRESVLGAIKQTLRH